jgi:hypothetical protein
LPKQFEQSLQRLRTLHAQVKAIVGKTFADGVDRKTSAELGLTARRGRPAVKMREASPARRTPPRRIRKKKRGRRA